jgi:hypothetical protein
MSMNIRNIIGVTSVFFAFTVYLTRIPFSEFCLIHLTFILRTFNIVIGLLVQNCPLYRFACLTISVCILCTEDNEIMK